MRCRTLFLLVALFALVAVCTFPCVAYADQTAEEELTDSVGDALDGLDLTDFSEAAADYIDSVTDKILALASGEFDDVGSVFALLAEIFVDGLAQTLPALLSIFAVTVICGLCRKTADGLVSQNRRRSCVARHCGSSKFCRHCRHLRYACRASCHGVRAGVGCR